MDATPLAERIKVEDFTLRRRQRTAVKSVSARKKAHKAPEEVKIGCIGPMACEN